MLCSMWDLSSPTRIKLTSPALEGKLLTTEPPQKSLEHLLRSWHFAKYTAFSCRVGRTYPQLVLCLDSGGRELPSGKEPIWQCRRHKRCRFDPWVGKIPWRRAWQPTPAFLPGESHGQRSLAGYLPQGCKESDTTEAIEQCVHAHEQGVPAKCCLICKVSEIK